MIFTSLLRVSVVPPTDEGRTVASPRKTRLGDGSPVYCNTGKSWACFSTVLQCEHVQYEHVQCEHVQRKHVQCKHVQCEHVQCENLQLRYAFASMVQSYMIQGYRYTGMQRRDNYP